MSTLSTVAIHTSKGGTAKTTTAHSLACELAARGYRVLALDLDRQGTLSEWFGGEVLGGRTLYAVAQGECSMVHAPLPSGVEGLDVIPGGPDLSSLPDALRRSVGSETWLRRQLELLPRDTWDFCILDCGPAMDLTNSNALIAARWVVSPVELEPASFGALEGVVRDISACVETGLNPALELAGILACRVDRRRALTVEALAELRGSDLPVFETEIPSDVRVAEAPGHGPLREHAPKCRAAQAYAAFADEFLRRVGA